MNTPSKCLNCHLHVCLFGVVSNISCSCIEIRSTFATVANRSAVFKDSNAARTAQCDGQCTCDGTRGGTSNTAECFCVRRVAADNRVEL